MEKDRFILFTTLLNDAQKSIVRLKGKKMDLYGLGSAHTTCIYFLQDISEGITKTELAHLCGVDKAQISRVISDLLQKDYVSIADPQLNYKQKYVLTEEGRNIAEQMRQTILDVNAFVSGTIPKEQIDNFYATLQTISDNLKKAEEKF